MLRSNNNSPQPGPHDHGHANNVRRRQDPTTQGLVIIRRRSRSQEFHLLLDANGFTDVDFVLNIGHDLKGNNTSGISVGGCAWSDVLINVVNNVNITSDLTSPGGDNRYSGILWSGMT
jgi:hypothetical protein